MDETVRLAPGGFRLKTKVYRSTKVGDQSVLVVVLHGDSPFRPPSYQYEFARVAAGQIDNVIVGAPPRPGYRDDTGDCSSGERGLTTGDNYTPEVVDAVAQEVDQLRTKYHAAEVVLVGHSGGAAITGDLLGRWPSKADGALLVSCRCDLVAWRKHMFETRRQNPVWLRPVRSLSPMDLAKDVSERVHVRKIA
jgi:pimeloyl-ACP methyl ester carboxylesterase